MSSAIPFCGANQLLFSAYHKVIYGIFCLKFSSLRGRGWLCTYLLLLLLLLLLLIIIIIIIDRACEVVRILRISPFSLKKGTCQAPRHFDLDYRLLDTVNLLLLSLYMYLIVIQEAFAVLTSWLPRNCKINCVISFSGK